MYRSLTMNSVIILLSIIYATVPTVRTQFKEHDILVNNRDGNLLCGNGNCERCSSCGPPPRKLILVTAEKTINDTITCMTKCDSTTRQCDTLFGRIECQPEEYTYFPRQLTLGTGACATACLPERDNSSACFNSDRAWVKCKPFEDKRAYATAITRGINTFGTYTDKGYRICHECQNTTRRHEHLRRRRDFNFLNREININAVRAEYEAEFPTNVVRDLDPAAITDPDQTNPVLSYIMFPIPGVWMETLTLLPLAVTSIITNHTRPATVRRGNRMSEATKVHYRNMQPFLRDERCHIVAHRFNGPAENFNIFPGTWDMNRGADSQWARLENDIAAFVHAHHNAYVEHTAVLSYDFDHPDHPYRPNAVGIRLRYYNYINNRHVLSDRHGTPLRNRRNPYENMYFNNDPDYCCSAELIED